MNSFFYSGFLYLIPDLYAIIAIDIFIIILAYTPLVRDWFISQIFTKKLHTSLLLIGTGIGSIINKTVENDDNNNSETHETDQSKNKSTVEISKSVTKKSLTNMIGSTTSTTESVPPEKNMCRTNETNKIEKQ